MESPDVIAQYETVAVIMGQMLSAARNANWGLLVELETSCSKQITLLKQASEAQQALTGPSRERKATIIKQILADDREIRNITAPWMVQLSTMLSSAGTERKLSQAYNSNLAC